MNKIEQFIRCCSLLVVDQSGKGVDLSDLKIVFQVQHAIQQRPRQLLVRVYNPLPEHARKGLSEFTRIILSAGYESNYAMIFDGNVQQARSGQERGTDTFIDIVATAQDAAYTQATSNRVLPEGWSYKDVHEQVAMDFTETIKKFKNDIQNSNIKSSDAQKTNLEAKAQKITAGTLINNNQKAPRPKVIYGNTRDHARNLGNSTQSQWLFNGNRIDYYPIDNSTPLVNENEAIVLEPRSGLIGRPIQAQGEINATCLLNPRLSPGTKVKIDSAYILAQQVGTGYTTVDVNLRRENGRTFMAGISKTGIYRVISVDHRGDTRGNEWYSQIICIDAANTSLMSKKSLEAVG